MRPGLAALPRAGPQEIRNIGGVISTDQIPRFKSMLKKCSHPMKCAVVLLALLPAKAIAAQRLALHLVGWTALGVPPEKRPSRSGNRWWYAGGPRTGTMVLPLR